MAALEEKKYELAKNLLPYSELDEQDEHGNTALHIAVDQDPSEPWDACIIALLSEGADDILTNQNDNTAETLLDNKESESIEPYYVD